ncbi:MAG: thermonuclease family protein [Myxococcales bacterium]|nr:thermonuclease family protein [Myxococcales bacterium]
MSMRIIQGTVVIVGKNPDGDSIRFQPDDPSLFDDLYRRHLMKFTRQDGSIQLRLEGIDTPETHYGSNSQPYGAIARDALLELLGYRLGDIQFANSGVVTDDGDQEVRVTIATSGADANGRPISLLYKQNDAPAASGTDLIVTPAHTDASMNLAMLRAGHAYPGLYTSMSLPLRKHFRAAAKAARAAARGLWPTDSTEEFPLRSHADIEPPSGALIMPKLFRRSVDFIKAVMGGFDGNLSDWLEARSGGSRPENDLVLLNDGTPNALEVPFSSLIGQRNSRVVFSADVCDIAFVEK